MTGINSNIRRRPIFSLAVMLGAMLTIAVPGGLAMGVTDDDDDIPAPQNLTLTTKDDLLLRVTWYEGKGGGGKESVPVIMCHGWDGGRDEFAFLAGELQKAGHSVIVPDLRGHGESMRFRTSTEDIDRERMRRDQIATMAFDLEACKKFLVEKNDEGILNIDMLTIVAAEESCIIAANWTVTDWSYPALGGRRQGQDVKALIMLSPERRFKGLTMIDAMRNPIFTGQGPANPLGVIIAVGGDSRSASSEARALYQPLERLRPKLDLEGKSAEERNRLIREEQNLFYWAYEVDYQGSNLVHPQAELPLARNVGEFIRFQLVMKATSYPWRERGGE